MKPRPSENLEIIYSSGGDYTGVLGAGLYALQNIRADKEALALLRLILGGAGSGKTSYIVGEIRSRLGRAADMVLLAPEQYSHRYERLLAASCGPALSLSAEVLSFTRLYSQVAAQIGGLADPIPDRGGRLLLMSLALDSAAPKLRYYGSRSGRAEFLLPILKAAEEIRAAMISPSALLEASEAAEAR
jgi:ATP-dependent helicase/nuclease subunit B